MSPSDTPSDIYKIVAEKTVIALEKIISASGREDQTQSHDDDRPSDAQLAQWWLDFGVTRKVTKRNCMTFPYGSKQCCIAEGRCPEITLIKIWAGR